MLNKLLKIAWCLENLNLPLTFLVFLQQTSALTKHEGEWCWSRLTCCVDDVVWFHNNKINNQHPVSSAQYEDEITFSEPSWALLGVTKIKSLFKRLGLNDCISGCIGSTVSGLSPRLDDSFTNHACMRIIGPKSSIVTRAKVPSPFLELSRLECPCLDFRAAYTVAKSVGNSSKNDHWSSPFTIDGGPRFLGEQCWHQYSCILLIYFHCKVLV